MIAKAIREEHPSPRQLYLTVEHFFKGYPGFSMLVPKIGGVAAHLTNAPAALRRARARPRLPEGRKGTEKLYKDRYRLRRHRSRRVRGGGDTGRGQAGSRLRRRSRGGRPDLRARQPHAAAHRADLLSDPPTFPWLGPLGMLGYLPAVKLRFLGPIDTIELGGPPAVDDKALVQTIAQEVRAPDPGEPAPDGRAAQVRVVWLIAVPSRRILVTGLSTYWGARLAQALEGFRADRDDHRGRRERADARAGANGVRQGLEQALAAAADRPCGRDRHRDRHAPGHGLQCRVPAATHENNVIGTMNILATCTGADSPVRKFVFKSSANYYGSEQDDPAFFTERMRRPHPPPSMIERDIVEAEEAVADFADKRPEVTVTVLRCAHVLGPDVDTISPACSGCRSCRWCSGSTRGFSSCTRTTSSTRSSTRR